MSYITKNKNFIEFYRNNSDIPYKLNINTGEFFDTKNILIHGCPTGFKKTATDLVHETSTIAIKNVLLVVLNTQNTRTIKDWDLTSKRDIDLMTMADKLASIGYPMHYASEIIKDNNLEILQTYFKIFAKNYKEDNHYSICYFLKKYGLKMWLEENHIDTTNPHITEDMLYTLKDYAKYIKPKYYNLALWYMAHGLYGYHDNDGYEVMLQLRKFFKFADGLNQVPEKTNNFMVLYNQFRETYYLNKEQIDNQQLIHNQLSHNLEFQNDTFQVIVPTTREEFEQEAIMQNNCVYRWYLSRVIDNETNVVFIRKKNDLTHSYITCEVDLNGCIRQYLKKFNYYPSDKEDIDFKTEYQEYLNENYK